MVASEARTLEIILRSCGFPRAIKKLVMFVTWDLKTLA